MNIQKILPSSTITFKNYFRDNELFDPNRDYSSELDCKYQEDDLPIAKKTKYYDIPDLISPIFENENYLKDESLILKDELVEKSFLKDSHGRKRFSATLYNYLKKKSNEKISDFNIVTAACECSKLEKSNGAQYIDSMMIDSALELSPRLNDPEMLQKLMRMCVIRDSKDNEVFIPEIFDYIISLSNMPKDLEKLKAKFENGIIYDVNGDFKELNLEDMRFDRLKSVARMPFLEYNNEVAKQFMEESKSSKGARLELVTIFKFNMPVDVAKEICKAARLKINDGSQYYDSNLLNAGINIYNKIKTNPIPKNIPPEKVIEYNEYNNNLKLNSTLNLMKSYIVIDDDGNEVFLKDLYEKTKNIFDINNVNRVIDELNSGKEYDKYGRYVQFRSEFISNLIQSARYKLN